MIDVNQVRGPAMMLHNLTDVDREYVFYYDETNNIRRLVVTQSGLNVPDLRPFALGGVACTASCADFEIADLRAALRLQKSVKEMKLEHLGKGNFLQILASKKIEAFLDWLQKRRLFVHYSVLDPLYCSIVDIIDSILTEIHDPRLMMQHATLKNDLYRLLRHDAKSTVTLFKKFSYPNVGRVNRVAFLNELLQRLESNRHLFDAFALLRMRELLRAATALASLPYLEDEKPDVLIDEFSLFHLHRICLFKNSLHIMDTEEEIKARFANDPIMDNGRVLNNHRFVRSHDEPGVQISDVIIGMVGKCFDYLIRTSMPELMQVYSELLLLQRQNLEMFSRLLDASKDENAAFAHYTLSSEDQERAAAFLRV
jgi:hypothetical protein